MFCCHAGFEARSPLLRGRFREPDEIGDEGLVSVLTEILPLQVSVATGILVLPSVLGLVESRLV